MSFGLDGSVKLASVLDIFCIGELVMLLKVKLAVINTVVSVTMFTSRALGVQPFLSYQFDLLIALVINPLILIEVSITATERSASGAHQTRRCALPSGGPTQP